eukprot:scaffold23477_cov60-Phaeocystis_antarctica.AAC.5
MERVPWARIGTAEEQRCVKELGESEATRTPNSKFGGVFNERVTDRRVRTLLTIEDLTDDMTSHTVS